jgi:long-subunit acyl-CoA synthetase (AMP-forming)
MYRGAACVTCVESIVEALQGVIGARAIVTTINIRLTKHEVDYILVHSGAKLIFVDYEYKHLVGDATVPIVVCNDTGRVGDPYEDFLTTGRAYSQEKGWAGLEMDSDENKPLSLNYTYVPAFFVSPCFDPRKDRVPLDAWVIF